MHLNQNSNKNTFYYLFTFMVCFFFACSDNQDQKYKIGFANCFDDDNWRISMVNSMKVESSLHSDVDLKVFESRTNVALQISQVKSMIEDDFDLIMVSPLDADSIVPVLELASRKKIPVILIDRKANSNAYASFIGADNYEIGKLAAKYLVSATKGTANVVEIYVSPKTSVGYERSKGFKDGIEKYPNIQIKKRILAAENDNHAEVIEQTIDSIQNIDYFFAFNDLLAYEAWKIAKYRNKNPEIKFIGVDGLNTEDGGIEMVKNNILQATVLYPTGGQEAIQIARRILKGERVPKNVKLNTIIIDSLNAEIIKNQLDKIQKHQNDIETQQDHVEELKETFSTQANILKVLLFLLITSLLLGGYSIYSMQNIKKKKRELELQNKKITIQRNQITKKAEEVRSSNEAKVNFFTGMSHEFRTPISLILSSTQSLSENTVIRDNKLINEIGLIYNNSKRLLRLINQVLDFRKIEDQKFVLRASKTNLYEFTNSVFKDFKREALRRSIDFNLTTNNEDLQVYIDRDLMDKAYFNLLSNAFKFTPNNGAISIKIEDDTENNYVKIYFKDSGIGIPKDEINNVFQVFYQGSNNNKAGSGIGLNLTKEYIEKHKGKIEVKSKHGTEFIITLYKDCVHLNPSELIYEPDIIDTNSNNFIDEFEENTNVIQKPLNEDGNYSILIIEDNHDLIKFLKSKLSLDYIVHTSDGSDGIEMAADLIPDIIICDINLPNKSGFEVCEVLKNDLRTSHIPIVILTALNNKESYIRGLESGADLYLTKPFSLSVLAQSIKTLIYNKERLRYYFVNNVHNLIDHINYGSLEQEFIQKINKVISDNLDNHKFSVENLADQLSLSRMQLYRKVKAIVGMKVSDYIQDIRLEKAKSLLQNAELTISEIAYATGFSSPSYFSTSFKGKFKKTPKAFKEEFTKSGGSSYSSI